MNATVIDIKGDEVYLQVGDELRFRAHYIASQSSMSIYPSALIDFDLEPGTSPAVIIRRVEHQSVRRFPVR